MIFWCHNCNSSPPVNNLVPSKFHDKEVIFDSVCRLPVWTHLYSNCYKRTFRKDLVKMFKRVLKYIFKKYARVWKEYRYEHVNRCCVWAALAQKCRLDFHRLQLFFLYLYYSPDSWSWCNCAQLQELFELVRNYWPKSQYCSQLHMPECIDTYS